MRSIDRHGNKPHVPFKIGPIIKRPWHGLGMHLG